MRTVDMLRIRQDQMAVFSQIARQRFEDRMVAHLRQFFPDQCQALGEAGTRRAIQHGIERAAVYGITAERDVCKYINVMFVFGWDFDVDPTLPWAKAILTDVFVKNPSLKADRLHEAATECAHEGRGIALPPQG